VRSVNAKCNMRNRVNIKEEGNIFFHALPYAILISSLTIAGLFGGYALGKGIGSSTAGFAFSLLFSFLGFFSGLFLSYLIVQEKHPIARLLSGRERQ